MWLFTSDGFISVVADRDDLDTGRLLVRARDKSHISNILPDAEIFSKQPSDYQWRAWISRDEFIEVLTKVVSNINYSNFKNSITDDRYHDACLDIWEIMYFTYRSKQ